MTVFDQLYEFNDALISDEMWISALESAFNEFGVKDLEELVSKAMEEDDETMVYELLNEGQYILSLNADDALEWYDDDEFSDDY
jgi:hypothetical protein